MFDTNKAFLIHKFNVEFQIYSALITFTDVTSTGKHGLIVISNRN